MIRIIPYILIVTMICGCGKTKEKSKANSDINKPQNSELAQSMERGKDVYNNFCIACHMANGKGYPKTFPPLANSDYLMNNREESIKAIKYGLNKPIVVNGETYTTPMARLGLSDKEIADVMNYITNSWGNKNDVPISEKEVSKIQP